MNYFLAVNDRQLGTCLRMLFTEKLQHCSRSRSVRRTERALQDHDFVSYSISKVKGP